MPRDSQLPEPDPEERRRTAEAISDLLNTPGIACLVAAYFDPDGPFAGASFDNLEPNVTNTLTTTDLLAITFLDVSVKPRGVRYILGEDASRIEQLLEDVDPVVPLWEASDELLSKADAAWHQLKNYDGVDEVTAGKLLARKRPSLIPIVDSTTWEVLKLPAHRAWTTLRAVLRDNALKNRIEELRPTTAPVEEVTTLRILDAATWMRGSNGRKAKEARKRCGVPDLPEK